MILEIIFGFHRIRIFLNMIKCLQNSIIGKYLQKFINLKKNLQKFMNLKNPRDEAWKNKDMDRSNVPKLSGLCWHKFRIFLSVVRGWAEDPLAGFWN